ncbi:MAG: PAS domain S-box protein [Methylobacteriaceae bacterium]|nr:PAS domain S-box protein [Methylobacteriaceae bacterium]
MAGLSNAPAPSEPEVERLLEEPAFRELCQRGSPAFAASLADGSLIWANAAARQLLQSQLARIPERLAAGSADAGTTPRLKRLLVDGGAGVKPLSVLIKRAFLADGREILLAAVLGAPAAERAPDVADEVRPGAKSASAPKADKPDPSPPAAEATPGAAKSAAEIRATLLKAHRYPTIRFLWQTDETGRIISVTPPLADIVGAAHGDLAGRNIVDVVEDLLLDPGGRILAAMQVPETWGGIEVAWPIAAAAAAVPVDLGGLPVFDQQRTFRGFRGFGVMHLDRVGDATPPAQPREAQPLPPSDATPRVVEQARPILENTPSAEPAAAAPPEPAVTAPNVVPLRPYAALGGAFGSRGPASDLPAAAHAEPGDPAGKSLSDSEHKAFDEIARALNEDATAPPEPSPAGARAGAGTAHAIGAAQTLSVLDRLPVGVLISRGATALYANRMLLDLAEYASIADLEAAGGLERLFAGPAPLDSANAAGTAALHTRGGNTVAIESKLQAISWEERPASLITVRRADDGAHFATAQTLQLELQQSDAAAQELRAILDAATDGVAILDADGRILSLNRSAETLFGYQQNEVAGEPFAMLIAMESRRLVEDDFGKVKSAAAEPAFNRKRDVYLTSRQGGTIPVSLTLGSIASGEGRLAKMCAVIHDTSAWKRTEHEAREAREEAERASAVKTDFLAKVSHEIRTPLNAIIGFAEVIMDERLGPIGTERYKDYLRDIHKSGTHVMSLVNDLLDLSKIEAGKMVLDIKSVDANAIIAECVALMQPQANRERVIMRLALAPRLQQIAADERSVRQIVLNLLSNAVKYNEPGGQVIVSTATSETGHVAVRIKDTGIGMSDAEIALALEPFRQVATARSVSGTGLGLPLTKALVEANRANFTIRSRKNEGTLVEVSFPPARVLAESA